MHILLDDDRGRLTLRRLWPWQRVLVQGAAARLDRALANGAPNIERVDKLVQTIAAGKGKRLQAIDDTVTLVDGWVTKNRQKAT